MKPLRRLYDVLSSAMLGHGPRWPIGHFRACESVLERVRGVYCGHGGKYTLRIWVMTT